MAEEEHGLVPHVQIKFFTKQKQYSIPDVPYSLPSSVSTKELNGIIHSVLFDDGDGNESRPEFDFLINGEFLRSNLETFLEDKNISPESLVEVEYVEQETAPHPESSLNHDDWVSCVRGSNELILCGCYDNTLRLWNRRGKCLTTIPGHTSPVKCVAWLKKSECPEDSCIFASGSHDQTLFIWKYQQSCNDVECTFACRGHAGSVDCIAVNADGERIVSGSWDKMIKLWSAGADGQESVELEEEEEESRKKKKMKSSGHKVTTRVPLVTLSGHKEGVSSAVWTDSANLCTASWDHTIRTWDMTRCEQTAAWEGSKAFFSISHSVLSNLVVSASADRHVRLHDLRTREMKGTYTSHTGWVSSVDWSKTNEHLFLSGSHDMVMKLWDTRSPKAPLYNLTGQEDKILAVDWSIPDLMLSGGADNCLKIFNYERKQ